MIKTQIETNIFGNNRVRIVSGFEKKSDIYRNMIEQLLRTPVVDKVGWHVLTDWKLKIMFMFDRNIRYFVGNSSGFRRAYSTILKYIEKRTDFKVNTTRKLPITL